MAEWHADLDQKQAAGWKCRATSGVFPATTGGVTHCARRRRVQSLRQVRDQGRCDGNDRERWCREDATDSYGA